MTLTAIDCQSFAGGFSLGVNQAGFKVIAKREHTGGFGSPLAFGNRHLLGYDWELEAGDADTWTPMAADLVFGNPPCAGFSTRSSRIYSGSGHENIVDEWNCSPAVEAGERGMFWWGKGIPVGSGRWIAEQAASYIEGDSGLLHGDELGEREHVINVEKWLKDNEPDSSLPEPLFSIEELTNV